MTNNIKVQKGSKLRDKSMGEVFEVNIVGEYYVYYMNDDAEGQVPLKNLSQEFEVMSV